MKKRAEKQAGLQNIKKSLRSVRFTVWIYFAIFIVAILVLIWITFTATFTANYRTQKENTVRSVGEHIVTALYGGGLSGRTIDALGRDNDLCIILQDSYGITLYSYDALGGNCYIHGSGVTELAGYRTLADSAADGQYYTEMKNETIDQDTILLVRKVGDVEYPMYVFINTTVEPVAATVSLIRSQMMQISAAMLILGFGISIFLSNLISRPIVRITRSARKLGQGDYNVEFNGSGYTETEQLADTLNFASHEISKVDGMRRDLMANISHDLRTPLTMVKAYAEMIRDLSGDDPVKRAQHLDVIIDESDRLAALVNDILDLTKLENGTGELNLGVIDLHGCIESIMTRYTILSEQQGYTFIVSVPEGMYIKADEIKLEQVLYNLINNAVNYSGEEKTIYVTAVRQGGDIEVAVTDTGEGISKELMPLIFDRYYRAEKSKREVIGTGLGLSIVKQILILHGFEFGVRSEVGTGSTFWFRTQGVEGS
ncbi:MAG: HAMP domain-containing protein [Oscillospiraceae bacterium]|nr:HAMP domain-containing protein [Oscillospiraceae bacterium]